MEWRPFDIKVISADNLKNVSLFFSPMDVYVEVSIFGYAKNKKKTFVDKNGGTNPKWNHSMKFTLDEHSLTQPALSLFFRIKSKRFLWDKDIGIVSIPIQLLFSESASDDNGSAERFVEYQVMTTNSMKPKGTLKFSYKFGKKFAHQNHVVNQPIMNAYHQMPMAYQQHPGYPPYTDTVPPPHGYGGYPGPAGYGYPPPPPGYGYPPMQQQQQVQQTQKKSSSSRFGGIGGIGLGLGAGLLGGMLVGDMVSDD